MADNIGIRILGTAYGWVPTWARPIAKKMGFWLILRVQSIVFFRRVCKGTQVRFLDFEIADLERIEFLGPDKKDVLVEVHKTVVSPGTEVAVLRGLPGARRSFPYSPGYSAVGRIEEVGSRVKGLSRGDFVAGRIPHCSRWSTDAGLLFKVPDGVSAEEAAFLELGIIVLQGIRKARIGVGDRVAVLGQGLIGQMTNRIARVVGASTIVALAPSRNRSGTATLEGGADEYLAFGNDISLLDKVKADVVIEAVGTPGAAIAAMRSAGIGGRVVLLGSARGLGRDVDIFSLAQERQLEIIGAHISAMPEKDGSLGRWTYRQEGELFFKLLQEQRLRVEDLITWRAKPEECNRVFEILAKGGDRHVGILFDWKPDL